MTEKEINGYWCNVNRKGIRFIKDEKGCRIRTHGATNRDGYPTTSYKGKTLNLCRVMYETVYGLIPPGMVVRHKCDNRQCINPEHLEVGTHADNVKDMDQRGRRAVGERNNQAKLTEAAVLVIKGSDTNAKELAEKFGVGVDAINRVRQGKTWTHVGEKITPPAPKTMDEERIQKLRQSGICKLTENKAREIRSSDELSCDLARKYGVSKATIRRVRQGVIWKNI
jgi:hypothetical protein